MSDPGVRTAEFRLTPEGAVDYVQTVRPLLEGDEMMKRALFLLLCVGCNQGEGYLNQQYLVTCPNNVTDTTQQFCIDVQKTCTQPPTNQICSWNWYHDVSLTENFTDPTVVKNACVGKGIQMGAYPDIGEADGCSGEGAGGSGGGSGTPTTGDPTTGAPTTGESTGETDGGNLVYLCSLSSAKKCANLLPDDALGTDIYYDENPLRDHCWAKVNTESATPIYSKCAEAPDVDAAKAICEANCRETMEMLTTTMKATCGWTEQGGWPPGCQLVTDIDCEIDGHDAVTDQDDDDDIVALESEHPSYECDGAHLIEESSEDSSLFLGVASVVTPDGYTVGASNVMGTLDYTLSGCNSTTCQITLEGLVGLSSVLQGGFTDASGAGGTYLIQEVGFQARNDVSGTWYKQRGTIVFPNESLDLQFWSGVVDLDGLTVPGVPQSTVSVNQLVGNLPSETSPLTLNLSYSDSFGVASFSLTTLPN